MGVLKPRAVLISDVHFNINTLEIAAAALAQAIKKAEQLQVPLIVAGDLHDTKAALRGECVKAMIKLFQYAKCQCLVLVGNHDLINEKGNSHSLEFLRPYVTLLDNRWTQHADLFLVPYQTNQINLRQILSEVPKGSTLICHQGVNGAQMGHYSQDRTSIAKGYFKDFRTISGHYHTRQTIDCGGIGKGHVGQFDYIGNPYTLTYGEANDPEKGFQVLNTDGSLTFVPTNLRKHVVVERTLETLYDNLLAGSNDLVKFYLHGVESEIAKVKKRDVGMKLLGHCNFIFEKVPTKSTVKVEVKKLPDIEVLDKLIDAQDETADHKQYLKSLWREVAE